MVNCETGPPATETFSERCQIGGTLFVLMLIAVGALAVRFVLVLAYGVVR